MSDEPFGRQLKPVIVTLSGGDEVDRLYWKRRLRGWLEHQPCVTDGFTSFDTDGFRIYPDANND